MRRQSQRLESACVFCGSSDAADPEFLAAAATVGKALADSRIRLVYGGGGVGLMGATAKAAHEAGGDVLGIIPTFLVGVERALETVEHIIVDNMHERKMLMFQRSDSFVVLPGGIGTLEEVVELLSWRRLDLHAKPVVFYNPRGFWDPLFALFKHTVDERLTPPDFMEAWVSVTEADQVVPALLGQAREPFPSEAAVGRRG
ncbi:MAG: TIGR00730 family Rossman fold protein [Phenylobacterium sp.]|uniref:LOG family protein n=1 Tax=Phenylobacterium sp. SCN 70-31 TaxID=1660129 RepID=UPI00086F4E84|nr:TIGR00730 family Rossman fold protein [Phenylobacterium sp. SCN 70-31]MCW5760899.1 TIGR00730 family Rossman fold protein [Phenylobacterium sp.]ODT87054.1 MAG: Rossman fold protein, TIGR00730 family [Phenylobacterium sp. SCN 70-31]